MEDLLFVVAALGFFALGLAYVRLCDRIIGPDPAEAAAESGGRDLAEVGR
jgi:hypothetical protein